jgi:hypothetical protein
MIPVHDVIFQQLHSDRSSNCHPKEYSVTTSSLIVIYIMFNGDDDSNVMKEGKLYSAERFWVDHQPWLKSCGYTLRDRYQPDWVASWLKPGSEKRWRYCEDALVPDVCNILSYSLLLN